jgi:uncharacterized protein (TIGR00251 family)
MMLRDSGDEVRLAVHVQPRARSTVIAGMHGDALKIRLTAPPVGGAANEALLDLLSDVIGVARSNLRIVSGGTSRNKTVGIRGVTIDAVRRALLP